MKIRNAFERRDAKHKGLELWQVFGMEVKLYATWKGPP
jgi:hypothetical protein